MGGQKRPNRDVTDASGCRLRVHGAPGDATHGTAGARFHPRRSAHPYRRPRHRARPPLHRSRSRAREGAPATGRELFHHGDRSNVIDSVEEGEIGIYRIRDDGGEEPDNCGGFRGTSSENSDPCSTCPHRHRGAIHLWHHKMPVTCRQTRFRLCFPRFMRRRRKVLAFGVVHLDGRRDLPSADRFGDECDVVSHLGSLNRSTL